MKGKFFYFGFDKNQSFKVSSREIEIHEHSSFSRKHTPFHIS